MRVCGGREGGELASDGSGWKGGVVRYLDWMCVAMAAGAGSLVRAQGLVRGDGWMEATAWWVWSASGLIGVGRGGGKLTPSH
jgi:hypothetical protein